MPERLPVIPDNEVTARLEKELPGWKLADGWLRRKYSTDGWPTTLMLVNTIGWRESPRGTSRSPRRSKGSSSGVRPRAR